MTRRKADRRGVGGERVLAEFTMKVASTTFNKGKKIKFSGSMVFNARGACLFIPNGFRNNAKEKVFREGPIVNVSDFEVFHNGKRIGRFHNLEMKLLGEKQKKPDCGLLIKFLHVSKGQLEKLNDLLGELPILDDDSVLFERTEGPTDLNESFNFLQKRAA